MEHVLEATLPRCSPADVTLTMRSLPPAAAFPANAAAAPATRREQLGHTRGSGWSLASPRPSPATHDSPRPSGALTLPGINAAVPTGLRCRRLFSAAASNPSPGRGGLAASLRAATASLLLLQPQAVGRRHLWT